MTGSPPPPAFEPHGTLERIELKVPLRSFDTRLAALIAVLATVIGAVALFVALYIPDALQNVFFGGVLVMACIPLLPRISDEEYLAITLDAATLTAERVPLGRQHHIALESIVTVELQADQLELAGGFGSLEFSVPAVHLDDVAWLVAEIRARAESRRLAMQGTAPASLQALSERG